jgi:hypothetical protein
VRWGDSNTVEKIIASICNAGHYTINERGVISDDMMKKVDEFYRCV